MLKPGLKALFEALWRGTRRDLRLAYLIRICILFKQEDFRKRIHNLPPRKQAVFYRELGQQEFCKLFTDYILSATDSELYYIIEGRELNFRPNSTQEHIEYGRKLCNSFVSLLENVELLREGR